MTGTNGKVRIAAIGDLHCPKVPEGLLQPLFAQLNERADVLLLCGDLTDYGEPDGRGHDSFDRGVETRREEFQRRGGIPLRRHTMLKERPAKDSPLHDEVSECIAACFGCILVCNRCSDGLIGMEAHSNAHLMNRCIRLCRDCAEICTLAARWISRTAPWSKQACHLCAEICDLCAESCEQCAPHLALCGVCAHECRRCAELCRQVAASATA